MNRPPAARRAPEAREADPTWARTGQPQRRWLALRSPRREPTRARTRCARAEGAARGRAARHGGPRAEGGGGHQDRRHLDEGAWRRVNGGETSGARVSTTRARVRSAYDGERECGARFGGRDGRVAVRVRVASRRARADSKPKPRGRLTSSAPLILAPVGAPPGSAFRRGSSPRASSARRSARSWDGSGQARESDNRRGRGGNEIHREGRAPRATASTAGPAAQLDAPLLPTLKLTRKTALSVVPVGRNAWVVRGALDARECDAIREAADARAGIRMRRAEARSSVSASGTTAEPGTTTKR